MGGMYAGMGKAPDNTFRLLGRCDLFVCLSTPDFYCYLLASRSLGIGLTGTSIEPIPANINGAHALGLFT